MKISTRSRKCFSVDLVRGPQRFSIRNQTPLQILPITLEGEYVRLNPLTPEHEEALNQVAGDGELWRTSVTIIPDRGGMRASIRAALDGLANQKSVPFVIVNKSTDRVVGSTRFYGIFAADRNAA